MDYFAGLDVSVKETSVCVVDETERLQTMQFARTVAHADLPAMQTLECKPCGLVVSAEAVTSSHALIEKRNYS